MESVEQTEGEPALRGVVPGRKVLLDHGSAAVMILPPRLREDPPLDSPP
jgi:hypothetical protein